MNNMPSKKSLMSLALGSAFAATLGAPSTVSAGDNPFAAQSLDKGYMLPKDMKRRMTTGARGMTTGARQMIMARKKATASLARGDVECPWRIRIRTAGSAGTNTRATAI